MSTTLRTNSDPTRTKTYRERLKRRYHSRWRDVRGAVRRELNDEAGLLADLNADRGVPSGQFRRWMEGLVEEEVLEPADPTDVRTGRHWTGPYVRDIYNAALNRAETQLRNIDFEDEVIGEATNIRQSEHQDTLRSEYVSTYTDTEDTVRDVISESTHEFREAFEEEDAARSDVVAAVNDRVDKVGETSTDRIAEYRGVETYNEALIASFGVAGVAAVGVAPEAVDSLRDVPADELEAGLREAELAIDELSDDALQWETAGDRRVCEQCRAIAGRTYSLEDIRERRVETPPIHANCRCVLVAVA